MVSSPPAKKAKVVSPSADAGQGVAVPARMPAQSPQVAPACDAAAVLVQPVLPHSKEEKLTCDVEGLMRKIIPWCRGAVLGRLVADADLKKQFKSGRFWMEQPLAIGEPSNSSMVGYKAAWSKRECETSIQHKQMYEAAVNIDWVKPFTNSVESRVFAGDVPTLEELEGIVATVFKVDDAALASSQGEQLAKEYRKSFPFTLAAFVASPSDLQRDAFEHSLCLLDGHAFVWAWWLHLYHLVSGDVDIVAFKHHIEVGLGPTLQVRVEMEPPKLAAWSAERSGMKQVMESVAADTFPAFAKKVCLMLAGVPLEEPPRVFKEKRRVLSWHSSQSEHVFCSSGLCAAA